MKLAHNKKAFYLTILLQKKINNHVELTIIREINAKNSSVHIRMWRPQISRDDFKCRDTFQCFINIYLRTALLSKTSCNVWKVRRKVSYGTIRNQFSALSPNSIVKDVCAATDVCLLALRLLCTKRDGNEQ